MKVLVLGSGNIGAIAAEDLAKSASPTQVVIADKDEARAKNVAERIGERNVSWIQLDTTDHDRLLRTLKNFALVMGFLPGKLGYNLMETCIEAKKNLVDVSYMAENPLELHGAAVKAGVTIVPDCGLAPGISNFLVGHTYSKLCNTNAIHIMVGGLPEKPVPPLGYTITWSPESLIDEYTRKAVIFRKGRRIYAGALSGTESVKFPGVGKLEAFYTDGLRTLAQTFRGVEEMWEKTLRYPGHAEKVKLLEALGLFGEKNIKVDGAEVSPRKLTVNLLKEKLVRPDIRDFVALKVEVCGIENHQKKRYVYHMLDRYDKKRGITAMARTTAYPMSIVAQLILNKTVKEKGVVPPEKLGMNPRLFKLFLDGIKKRGIKIETEKSAC